MQSSAKILEVGPYPPPLAGWAIRIKFVRDELVRMGCVCDVLNIGKGRRVASDEYIPVYSGFDYARKVIRYAARGYTFHLHVNGDDFVGLMLALFAAITGAIFGRRVVLSFHAGVDQVYFPCEKSRIMTPLYRRLFRLSQAIVCDNAAVKGKIEQYGIAATKVTAIQTFGSSYVADSAAELSPRLADFVARHRQIVTTYILFKPGFYVETFVRAIPEIVRGAPGVGIVIVGSLDDSDPTLRASAEQVLGANEHVLFTGNLAHDEFLTLLGGSSVMLRTPTTDGECASVLEALSLGIPVVAAENDNRPASVVTFTADDHAAMSRTTCQVLDNLPLYRSRVIQPEIRDTVRDEAELLVRAAWRQPAAARTGKIVPASDGNPLGPPSEEAALSR